MTGDDIVKDTGVYDALSIDKIDKKLEEMAVLAMDHPYAMWPSVLALAVLILTCIICVVRRRNFKKPTKTYVYKPLLDQEGMRFQGSLNVKVSDRPQKFNCADGVCRDRRKRVKSRGI